ncbi:hypothetical protein ACU61A_15955 [Pseudonocardia sichuanensis]
MTELGERFLLALRDQGYGVIITDEDVVIVSEDRKRLHHVPRPLFEDDPLSDALLRLAILGFIAGEPEFVWTWPGQGGTAGRN